MLKYCLLFLNTVTMISQTFTRSSINTTNLLRRTLIFDDNMPSAYIDKYCHIEDKLKSSIYSIEHIVPRCLLNKIDHNDMHNTIRTFNNLNVNRSNYKYVDIMTDEKNWIKLDYGNYVNHKSKLFMPTQSSRGFIARAILYMSNEYNYNPGKVISKDVLLKWFYTYPPLPSEKYHNDIIKKVQNKNNIFISNYNRKSKELLRYIDKL